MSLSLFWTYWTLERRVQKTRKAFEKQLVNQGMSKEDAKRLSACYEDLKNSITSIIRLKFNPTTTNIDLIWGQGSAL
jgi:hypothetical protein